MHDFAAVGAALGLARHFGMTKLSKGGMGNLGQVSNPLDVRPEGVSGHSAW